jgi:glycosyltransferase involved in cell wall biosynthesis
MLGWEYPPFISGGLGTACRGLTEAMKKLHTRILFVLPRAIDSQSERTPNEGVELEDEAYRASDESNTLSQSVRGLEHVAVPCDVTNPYLTATPRRAAAPAEAVARADLLLKARKKRPGVSSLRVVGVGAEDGYDGDLMGKINAYADRCAGLTRRELFDVIHAHDWMTFPAAVEIARFSGRPMIAHVHATEFDRSGDRGNQTVYEIERYGMHAAARVIAVSERTKRIIVQKYGVPEWKITVVHNGIEFDPCDLNPERPARREKVVLFLGRITRQKGPEYFVRAAARVAERLRDVRFVVAGSGDELPKIKRLADSLGLNDRIEFTGFLHGRDVDRAYERADVYAMPSVSEPFGLTALEAVRHGVPVILSKDSGVAEVLRRGTLKVDFWDVEMMAKMIVSVLKHPGLAEMLRRESAAEIRGLSWDDAARKCVKSYYEAVKNNGHDREAVAAGRERR